MGSSRRAGPGLFAAVVVATLVWTLPASAEILFARTRLTLVITEIVSSATDDWTTYMSCTVAHGGDRRDWRRNRWNRERPIVIATLWANDFPEDVIRKIVCAGIAGAIVARGAGDFAVLAG
jgi:hypothetical protein